MPAASIHLHAEAGEHERHGEHEQHLAHLPHGLRGGDVGHPRRAEEELREVVVRGQRDADEQRRGDEHVERPAAELAEGVEAQHAARRHRAAAPRRRRVGQAEAVRAEHEARHARRVERQRRLLGLQVGADEAPEHEADEQPGHDPADRAPHPDARELPLLVGDVVERQRAREPERRHVAEVVQEQQQDERRRVAGGLRRGEEHEPAGQVQHAEDLLRGEVPVGHEPDEERRGDGRDRVDRERPVGQRLHAAARHEHGDGRVPGPPDEELEEHHDAEPGGGRARRRGGRGRQGRRGHRAGLGWGRTHAGGVVPGAPARAPAWRASVARGPGSVNGAA
jgi:hypothetical protein